MVVASTKTQDKKALARVTKEAETAEGRRLKHELKFMTAAERLLKKEQLKKEKITEREKWVVLCRFFFFVVIFKFYFNRGFCVVLISA